MERWRDRWREVVLRALERRKGGWEEGIGEKMWMWWRGTPVGNSLPSCVIATCMHTHFLYYTDILLAGANWLLLTWQGLWHGKKHNIFLYCIQFFFSPHSYVPLACIPTQHPTICTQTCMHLLRTHNFSIQKHSLTVVLNFPSNQFGLDWSASVIETHPLTGWAGHHGSH